LSHADDALSLNIPEVNEEVFGWLKKIIKHTGLAVLNISDHIINLLTQYCRPSTNFYSCVRALDYGEAFADAVSSFLIYRTSVWNVHDVKELQQWICHEVLLNPDSIPALRILIALLACNHELVPIPIEVKYFSLISVNQNTLKIAKYSIDERKKTAEADQTGTYENFAHITNSSNFNGKDKSKQEDFAVNLISNNVDPIDIIIIESDVAKNKASSHPNQNARTVGNCNSDAMPRKGQTVITSTDGNEISVEQMLADFDPS
uniref:BACK domain-containing protein n=1 Tax=Dracunculus medinensis TaxID=318479 RepID=A0A0N4UR97_DRAME